MICANRIEAMLMPGTACAKRLLKTAKEHKAFLDLSFGRTTKCLLLLDGGKLVGCALTPKTIAARIDLTAEGAETDNEGEDANEDS